MSKEVFDLYRNLKTNQGALDLIIGLENRSCGKFNKELKCKESLEFYAEEQFLKKTECEELRCEMPGLPRSTFLMVFSPDGTRVASTHGNHNIYISDVRNGKHVKTLIGHPRTPWCIAFHPTSNQIVASGCLGGQVRIWDLSGGSEVWTAVNQTVIASLAFHPNDRLLVIATYNEVYFWDWSQPEPFVHTATNNPKEKVRYVAFDKLGHKLITGIANTPQTRWERARASVPLPRQERSSGSYRRRITQRLVSVDSGQNTESRNLPERERRITTCYRNLVREYETLVHRYLQLYRPPTMIDRGTDPMEPTPWYSSSGTQTIEPPISRGSDSGSGPSTSSGSIPPSQIEWGTPGPSSQPERGPSEPAPSTSRGEVSGNARSSPNLIKPSRISSVINKPSTLMRSTQTPEDRKHKNDNNSQQPPTKKHKTTNVRLIKRSVKNMRNAMRERERLLANGLGSIGQGPCEYCGTARNNAPAGDRSFIPADTTTNASSSQIPCSDHGGSVATSSAFSSQSPHDKHDNTHPTNSASADTTNIAPSGQMPSCETSRSHFSDSTCAGPTNFVPTSNRNNNGATDAEINISTDTQNRESTISLNPSQSSSSHAADSHKTTFLDCERTDENTSARSHDKYSLERDCSTKTDNCSTTSNVLPDNCQATTSSGNHAKESTSTSSDTAKNVLAAAGTKPKKAKKPIMVIKIKSTTIDTTYTPTITSTSGLRLRIPLDDNDSHVRATFEHSLLGNTTVNVPSSSNNNQEGRNTGSNIVQNSVDELLSNIRRTAEEEVRNRILPIIRSVPLNDRPELIRLFENSRESVRMRFRQLYPVLLRKPNRRFPNTPYPTTDSSSSSSEEDRTNNNSSTRRSDFSFNPISNPSSFTNRPQNVPRIRNFNTELEDLVTSLLSEIERTENRAGIMTVATSNSNCNITTTGNSAPLLTTVPWLNSSRVTTRPSDPPSSSQIVTPDNSTRFRPSNSRTSTPDISAELRPSGLETRRPDDTLEFRLSNQQTSLPENFVGSRPSNPLLFQECLNSMNSQSFLNSSTCITTTASPLGTNQSFGSSTTNALNSNTLPTSSMDSSILTTPTTEGSALSSNPATIVNTSTGTTNSTIYTSNTLPRRRFFSHRISAFLPTRVNYTRSPPSSRLRRATHFLTGGRLSFRNQQNSSFALDELINFSERENTEEDPPSSQAEPPNAEPPTIDGFNFNNVYSNILNEIGLVLTDIVEIRSARVEISAQQLNTFSDRLEHIENQCETVLRNLANSTDILGNNSETSRPRPQDNEPTIHFFDPNFYLRDQRDGNSGDSIPNESLNINDLFNTVTLRAVSADHTYPRSPEDSQSPSNSDNVNPLMSSVHIIVSHMQRQARFLRERIELIDNMDRMVEEVSQLQLIRRMLIDLSNQVRTRPSTSTESVTGRESHNTRGSHTSGESRSTGMSSVRQMMAGTRISDSGPQEHYAGETPGPSGSQHNSTSGNEAASEANNTSSSGQTRARYSNRKTYPPSRLHRLNRHYRRPPSILHFFSRRYLNRAQRNIQSPNRSGNIRQISQLLTPGGSQEPTGNLRDSSFSSFSMFNSNSLNTMASRFEQLLTAQMAVFNFPTTTPQVPRSNVSTDLGEHILSLRLHGCILRMNRIFRDSPSNAIGNYSGDPIPPVSRDGISRFTARQTLSLLVDSASRHLEICRNSASPALRQQVQRVLAMAYLLTELLLLTITDSIPSGSSFQWNPPHHVATLRVWHQMLTNRNSHYTHQLSTSWRLMRITMTHAQAALSQSYYLRRRVLIPCQNVDRIQLLGCINRLLKSCKQKSKSASSQEPSSSRPTNSDNQNQPSTSSGSFTSSSNTSWFNTTMRLIGTYRSAEGNRLDNEQPSTSNINSSRERIIPIRHSTENSDNSDVEEQPSNNNTNSAPSNLYRTNNMNLLQNDPVITLTNANGSNGTSNLQSRPWNVPSVQVNDVPISEPSTLAQHIMSQRQRFAELRSNPNVGFFRPRFLHPLYASVNPFDDLDEIQRDQIYDSDIITTVTPNHRIQAWDISDWNIPIISNTMKNLVVGECKIHNDASVDVARDGSILVTLLPSGGYLNVTNRLGVYSLRWETLGQCLYTTNFEQNAVSVSLSPLSRHLVVGLASRALPSERWIMARVFKIDQKDLPGDRLPVVKELEQNRDSRLNCIRWLPNSGQGLIYATNTGQLVILS